VNRQQSTQISAVRVNESEPFKLIEKNIIVMYAIHILNTLGDGFMRINVNLDDNLKFLAEHKAKSMGLSLSSFVRLLLSRETEDFRDKVDKVILQAEQSGYEEPIEWEDFKKQLEKDIHNAKN
jgi:antitoxin component of RelBE/YafQ-DinJ toxin-antitoxin module